MLASNVIFPERTATLGERTNLDKVGRLYSVTVTIRRYLNGKIAREKKRLCALNNIALPHSGASHRLPPHASACRCCKA